jgi:outer membrane lipoprotein-sorting protein
MLKRFLFYLLFLIACQASGQSMDYSPVKDLDAFKLQFASIAKQTQSLRSDFVQEKNMSLISEKITSKGKFWFKREKKVRMEYTQPFQYLIVINQDVISIKDGSKQNTMSLSKNKLFRQVSNIITDCVQGTALNNPDFSVKVFESKNNYLVEMTPVTKGMKDFFKIIHVTLDKADYNASAIEMIENSGDNTIIRFQNKEKNIPVPDAVFAL